MNNIELNSVNIPKIGTWYYEQLKDVECDMRLKQAICKIANDVAECDKRLNDCIKTLIAFADALNAVGVALTVEDKGYKKSNQTGE